MVHLPLLLPLVEVVVALSLRVYVVASKAMVVALALSRSAPASTVELIT